MASVGLGENKLEKKIANVAQEANSLKTKTRMIYASICPPKTFIYSMEIYIVRHGETVENNRRILQGHLPGRLTALGRQQVEGAAEELARSGVAFSRIVSSDLQRALDSAQLIADRLQLPEICCAYATGERLRECPSPKLPPGITRTAAGLFPTAVRNVTRTSGHVLPWRSKRSARALRTKPS